MDKPPKKPRGRTVPIHKWWPVAVRRELEKLERDQVWLAAEIDSDPPTVNKCIKLKVPTLELVIAISDALKLPYPVLLPEHEEDAFELAKLQRLLKSDRETRKITAGVPGVSVTTEKSQTVEVPSEHAFRERKPKGKTVSRVRGG